MHLQYLTYNSYQHERTVPQRSSITDVAMMGNQLRGYDRLRYLMVRVRITRSRSCRTRSGTDWFAFRLIGSVLFYWVTSQIPPSFRLKFSNSKAVPTNLQFCEGIKSVHDFQMFSCSLISHRFRFAKPFFRATSLTLIHIL